MYNQTLSERVKFIEVDYNLSQAEEFPVLTGSPISPQQKRLESLREAFQEFESNSVFSDATKGIKTITESYLELAQVNKGVRKVTPRQLDEEHNERLNHLEELVFKQRGLVTRGVLFPDNVITVTLGTAFIYSAILIASKLILPELGFSPENLEQTQRWLESTGLRDFVSIGSLYTGLITNVAFRFDLSSKNPRNSLDEATYLDQRVQEVYCLTD